jgi:lipopolysaccharide export system protein LptA
MTSWQRRARFVIAGGAVVFAVVVFVALKPRAPLSPPTLATPADPGAVVEVTGGRVERFKLSRQDVRVDYRRQLTYANGSTKLEGVTIAADARAGGRSFTVTGKEASVGQNESTLELNGDVRLSASDGMTARTEHASYSDKDAMVRAAGPVEFSRGLMTGSGVGMTYDTARDVLVILDRSAVHVAPDERGAGAMEIASGTASFARRDQRVSFDRDVKLERGGQTLFADAAVASLTEDEKQLQALELRGHSRVGMDNPAPGALQGLAARDIDLRYAANGQSLERAVLMGDGSIGVAGERGAAPRQIRASTIDVALAPDGATPVALTGRDAVVLTLPAEGTLPARTIRSSTLDSTGDAGHGLTRAVFGGGAQYREQGSRVDRFASAETLDVALKPAMAGIADAKFSHAARFLDSGTTSTAAAARYDLDKGTLELTGSEPCAPRPRVVNDQIAVDAARIDVTLAGPLLKAVGTVKSILQPAGSPRGAAPAPAARGGPCGPTAGGVRAASATPASKEGSKEGNKDAHLPSMFKQDTPVNVTADRLDYDGTTHRAAYTGSAQLWQEETSIKGPSITLDDDTGDLTAGGGVATVTVRDGLTKDKKPQRVRSMATAEDFSYEDASRRATYTGKAHMNNPDSDMTAAKIELYLKPSGDDLERAEAYDNVTLRDSNRTTTGSRLTYTTGDERYVVTGTPVKVLDECHRETTGRTLTYTKLADTITIDGNEQTRTQTKGNGQCP